MFSERKTDATISFTDVVQLMGAVLQKQKKIVFGMAMFFSLPQKMFPIHHFALVPKKHLTVEGLNNCSSRLYPPFTTFVTCRGTVGNLAMAGVSMAMNQSCYALKGKDDFPPLFVFSFTRYVIATMKKKHLELFLVP